MSAKMAANGIQTHAQGDAGAPQKIKLSQIHLYFFLWVTFSRKGNYEKFLANRIISECADLS